MARTGAVAFALAAASAASGCGGAGGRAAALPGGGPGAGAFTPYADVTLAQPVDAATVALHAPRSGVTLGFVTAVGGACQPAWGVLGLHNEAVDDALFRLRQQGRFVRVSFGGRNGTDLSRACRSPAALAAAYDRVADGYGLRAVDFDLEGAALADRRAVTRWAGALAQLERRASAAGRPLTVSLTLPALPSGLTRDGLFAVSAATRAGASVDVVNLLAMDYGADAAPRPAGRMGAYAIAAVRAARAQLARPLGGTVPWRRLGLTPMVGRNDVAGEIFTLADARRVAAFARDRGLGLVSMWSLARDRPCPPGTPPGAQPACSGVAAPPYAYARALALSR